MLQLRASVADSGPVSKNICVIGMDLVETFQMLQLKLKRVAQKKHKISPLLSPVGHLKFNIDQQIFQRFILYYRFSYYATFPR